MWIFQGHTLAILPSALTYGDFVAILLTAVSTLLAIFGIVLAVFALWGWSQFRRGVAMKISEIMPGVLSKELKSGSTRLVLDDLVIDFFRTELAKPGVAEAWAAERQRRAEELNELDEEPPEDR